MTDKNVIQYATQAVSDDLLQPILREEKQRTKIDLVTAVFDFSNLVTILEDAHAVVGVGKQPYKKEGLALLESLIQKAEQVNKTGLRFQQQVLSLCEEKQWSFLQQRINAAVVYFMQQLDEEFIKPLTDHQRNITKGKTRKYKKILLKTTSILRDLHQAIAKVKDVDWA